MITFLILLSHFLSACAAAAMTSKCPEGISVGVFLYVPVSILIAMTLIIVNSGAA